MANDLLHRISAPRKMELQYLRKITKQFSQDLILGSGGFGTVYKGEKEDGKVIAVKMLKFIPGMDDTQFLNEVKHVMGIYHPNIVRPEGYCYHIEGELMSYNGSPILVDKVYRLLCFEYLPNGCLDKHISDECSGLHWYQRYNIIEGICKGLYCLHEGRRGAPVLHLDLKPANVLLDEHMLPKIADFGQSRLFGEGKTHSHTINIVGSRGYMAPEYIECGMLTKESDIYSLGVVIVEIITGHRKYPENTTAQEFIEVHDKWRRRLQTAPNNTSLAEECRQVNQCIEIGLKCMERDSKKRPNIIEIIEILGISETANSSSHGEDSYTVEEQSREVVPPEWREAIDSVSICSPVQSFKGMETVFHKLVQIFENKSNVPNYIIKDVDELVLNLVVLAERTFKLILDETEPMTFYVFAGVRAINTLTKTLKITRLARAVKKRSLEKLLAKILILSMGKDGTLYECGVIRRYVQLNNSLDQLIRATLINTETISLFVALMNLATRPVDQSGYLAGASSELISHKTQEYSINVTRCLLTLSLNFPSIIEPYDLDRILQTIHHYLQRLGMEEIERSLISKSETYHDARVVTIMKILEKIVKLRGSLIKNHLSMVSVDASSQPVIMAYIDGFLEKLAADSSDDEEESGKLECLEWHEALDIVALSSSKQSIEAVEVICHELGNIDVKGTIPEYIIESTDRLVSSLTVMVERNFKLILDGTDSRSYKYTLKTLMRTFRTTHLGHAVKEATLESLTGALLIVCSSLVMDHVNMLPDNIKDELAAHRKKTGKLMQKIVDNAERTSMLVVLMNLLIRPLEPSRWLLCASSVPLAEKNRIYSGLVGHYLALLAKDTIGLVDVDRVLQSIHTYFEQLGIEEIERREKTSDDDVPIGEGDIEREETSDDDGPIGEGDIKREITHKDPVVAVIEVLKRLVQLRGSLIEDNLSMVPVDADPQPIIVAYIDAALEKIAERARKLDREREVPLDFYDH